MENRANYALVGLFATLVAAAMVGFVYWFMNAEGEGEQTAYAVVFDGAVTGLGTGTDVLFNGLRVGTVSNVRIDPEDPNRVVARIVIAADAPVRTDTQAILEVQALTGAANIQLLGGSADAPPLTPAEGEAIAVLRGEPSDIQALLEGAGSIVESAESAFSRIDAFLAANETRLSTTLANIESLSNTLAGFAADAGQGGGMDGMVTSLQQTIDSANASFSRIEALVDANAPALTAAIGNAESFSAILSNNSEGLDAFLAGLGETGDQIGPLTGELRALSSDLRALVAAVPPERLTASMESLERTLADASETAATIDALVADNAESLGTTLANAEAFSSTLAANSEGIDSFLVGLGETGDQIAPLTSDLRLLSADLRALVNAIPPEQITASLSGLEETIAGANATFAGIDELIAGNADSLNVTLANAERFSTTLADNTEGVDAFLASLSDAADQIGPLVEEVSALSADLGAIAGAISPDQVAATIATLEDTLDSANSVFATADTLLAGNAESLSSTIDNAERFSAVLAANSAGVDGFLTSLSETADEIGPLASEVRLLASDVRALVEVVPPQQVAATFSDVSEFANSLARNTDNIDSFFVDAGRLATNLSGVSQGLADTLALIDEASAAIDADVIANAMENIDTFSFALGSNAENIDRILGNTSQLTETLTSAASRIEGIIQRVDGLVATEGGESLFTDLSAAALSVRNLAEQLEVQAGQITGAVTGFANTGLSDYSLLAAEARAAVQQLQRVLSEIERNPQVVVFGGDSVRDFQR